MGLVSSFPQGLPLAEDRDLSLSDPEGLPHWLGWAWVPEGQGLWAENSQNAFCGSAFLGVGDQNSPSHWSSACQNKKLWFCVVTIFFFFFKTFCAVRLGNSVRDGGGRAQFSFCGH